MIDLVPPRRALPDQVRNRMLVDLRRRLDQPAKRSKTPYAVAAGVAALVAGGVVVATTADGGSTPQTVAGTGKLSGDKGVTAQAKRCQAASAKAGGFPANADWRAVTHLTLGGHTTIAFKVGADRPVFCDVTSTHVELSRYDATPAYAPGTKSGALMLTKDTQVLGVVVDPTARRFDAFEGGTLDSNPAPDNLAYKSVEHMVLWWPEYPAEPRTVSQDRAPQVPLPNPSGTTVTIVDRPYQGPPVDRTSDRGRFLAKVLAQPGMRVPDPDSWQPGAWAKADNDTFMVIRGVDSATFCTGGRVDLSVFPLWCNIDNERSVVGLPSGNQPVVASEVRDVATGVAHDTDIKHPDNSNRTYVLWGTAPMAAASMTVTTTEGATLVADVHNGTWAAKAGVVPDLALPDPAVKSVVVKDAQGKVLYQGKPGKN